MKYEDVADMIFEQIKKNNFMSLNDLLADFNKGEFAVLGYLNYKENDILSGTLSEKLNISTARVASILNSLEKKELVIRKNIRNDKRKTKVSISNKGKKLITNEKEKIIAKIILIIKSLSENELNEYLRISKHIKEILEKGA